MEFFPHTSQLEIGIHGDLIFFIANFINITVFILLQFFVFKWNSSGCEHIISFHLFFHRNFPLRLSSAISCWVLDWDIMAVHQGWFIQSRLSHPLLVPTYLSRWIRKYCAPLIMHHWDWRANVGLMQACWYVWQVVLQESVQFLILWSAWEQEFLTTDGTSWDNMLWRSSTRNKSFFRIDWSIDTELPCRDLVKTLQLAVMFGMHGHRGSIV